MTNLPVFFTSAAARVAKESMILAQTPLFSSCSSASAVAMAVFGMDLTTALLPFMAFIAFIGAMAGEVMRANARRDLTSAREDCHRSSTRRGA